MMPSTIIINISQRMFRLPLLQLLLLCLASIFFFNCVFVSAWGTNGHRIVAQIAQALLSPSAERLTRTLLLPTGGDGTLTSVATWADEVKRTNAYRWSERLHFINRPHPICTYDPEQHCHHVMNYQYAPNSQGQCLDGAIQNYTERLGSTELSLIEEPTHEDGLTTAIQEIETAVSRKNYKITALERSEALKFLIHFIGDIHQNLHVGYIHDRGGNNVRGRFLNDGYTKLHFVWDTNLINYRIRREFSSDVSRYVDYLLLSRLQNFNTQTVAGWLNPNVDSRTPCPFGACSSLWANESAGFVCSHVYATENLSGSKIIGKEFQLGRDYYDNNIPNIELRLIQAGTRLAHVLNNISDQFSAADVQAMQKQFLKTTTNYSTYFLVLVLLVIIGGILVLSRTWIDRHPRSNIKGE